MKKLLDKIWNWMKTTAWFQVVMLVGVVVAVVLCISPITKTIEAAVEDSKKTKYYMNNRINYDEAMDKIANVENEEFAILFGSGEGASSLEKGIKDYEEDKNAVKIYFFNIGVTDENKSKYNADKAWYEYYKVTLEEMTGFRNASINVYKEWKEDSVTNGTDVEQTLDYSDAGSDASSLLTVPSIMWFRKAANIDEELKTKSTAGGIDYHIAKVYLTIQDSSSSNSDDSTKTLLGLQKFFASSLLS